MTTTHDDDSSTGTLEAAREHARRQAAEARAETQATIPASAAMDLPDGVGPDQVVWDERLGAGGYAARRLRRGDVLRISDVTGDTCVNLQVHRLDQPAERLNPADTVKVQWQAYLGEGSLLLSDLGRVLMTIIADTSGRHDALCGHTTRAANDARYGDGRIGGPAPNTRDLLALAAARVGLDRRDLTAGIDLFTEVRVADDGTLVRSAPTGTPSHMELRAELDVSVLVAVGPHPLDDRPQFTAGPVRCTAWTAARPDADAFRASTPERQRAFENTEDLVLGSAR